MWAFFVPGRSREARLSGPPFTSCFGSWNPPGVSACPSHPVSHNTHTFSCVYPVSLCLGQKCAFAPRRQQTCCTNTTKKRIKIITSLTKHEFMFNHLNSFCSLCCRSLNSSTILGICEAGNEEFSTTRQLKCESERVTQRAFKSLFGFDK